MTTARKFTRAEPPALLTEPLAVTLDALDLDDLNEFRQAEHALHYPPAGMFGRQPDIPAGCRPSVRGRRRCRWLAR